MNWADDPVFHAGGWVPGDMPIHIGEPSRPVDLSFAPADIAPADVVIVYRPRAFPWPVAPPTPQRGIRRRRIR